MALLRGGVGNPHGGGCDTTRIGVDDHLGVVRGEVHA
jgi:hypothetical protein